MKEYLWELVKCGLYMQVVLGYMYAGGLWGGDCIDVHVGISGKHYYRLDST